MPRSELQIAWAIIERCGEAEVLALTLGDKLLAQLAGAAALAAAERIGISDEEMNGLRMAIAKHLERSPVPPSRVGLAVARARMQQVVPRD